MNLYSTLHYFNKKVHSFILGQCSRSMLPFQRVQKGNMHSRAKNMGKIAQIKKSCNNKRNINGI